MAPPGCDDAVSRAVVFRLWWPCSIVSSSLMSWPAPATTPFSFSRYVSHPAIPDMTVCSISANIKPIHWCCTGAPVHLPFLSSSAAIACVWSLAIVCRKPLISDSEIPAPGAYEEDAVTRSSMEAKGQRKNAWSTKPKNAGLKRGTSRFRPSTSNLKCITKITKRQNVSNYAEIQKLLKSSENMQKEHIQALLTMQSVPPANRPEPFHCPPQVLCPGGVSWQQTSHCP